MQYRNVTDRRTELPYQYRASVCWRAINGVCRLTVCCQWRCMCKTGFTRCGGAFREDEESWERGEESSPNVSSGAVEWGFDAAVRHVVCFNASLRRASFGCIYYASDRVERAISVAFVRPSVAYIANNSRTQRHSVLKFGMKVPILDATRTPVSRSNGQRSGLQTGGGIPCRPNLAATLLVCYIDVTMLPL